MPIAGTTVSTVPVASETTDISLTSYTTSLAVYASTVAGTAESISLAMYVASLAVPTS